MKVFVDANIMLDIFDAQRAFHASSVLCYEYLIVHTQIYTSCDLITTIYYINAKEDKKQALHNIQALSKTLKIIEFSNKEVEEACDLMLQESSYSDLEDTIQYIMAKKTGCELIISNDKNFVAKEIRVVTSEAFLELFKQA